MLPLSATKCTESKRSHISPALACRMKTRSPIDSVAAALPFTGVCGADRLEAGGPYRLRLAVLLGRAGGDVAAGKERRDLPGWLTHDGQDEERCGFAVKGQTRSVLRPVR